MKTIKILGGGISGLTAAITLKKAGFNVEIHEIKKYCGKHTNDFQFLENWTSKENILDYLKRIGIKIDFYTKPLYSQEILSPSLKSYNGVSKNVLMYLVKRGKSKNSIDFSLCKQALKLGVKIVYNSNLNKDEADIIAKGSFKPSAITFGIKFKINLPDKILVLLDNNLSYFAYSYLVINDNTGEITTLAFNLDNYKINMEKKLKLTIRKFEDILNIKISRIDEKFSGIVSYDFNLDAKINNHLLIGESAGFQDALAGFGMKYAFSSGYLAAQSIIMKKDYNKLWQKEFLHLLEAARSNRTIYNSLTNKSYERIINFLNNHRFLVRICFGSSDFQKILKRLYATRLTYFLNKPIIRYFKK